MSRYFPRHTVEWKLEEPPALRKLSMSLWEMALITGVLLRLYRALALTNGPTDNWIYLGATFLLGSVFFFGMATLHLGNYPVRHWLWRAPAFALIEAAAESVASLGLIVLSREPMGTERAHFHDWPGIVADTVSYRLLGILLFSLALAAVVQVVRYILLKRDDRVHTAEAVHDEMVKQPAGSRGRSS